MAKVKLFDLLGVAGDADPLAAAAALFPANRIQSSIGVNPAAPDATDLVDYLQQALEFRAIRPGSTSAQVGLTAEVIIDNPVVIQPLVLTQMPDVAFYLRDTPGTPDVLGYRPARLFVNDDPMRGREIVIESLPVEIQLPVGLLEPLRSEQFDKANPGGGPDVTTTDTFVEGQYDSLEVRLSDTGSSSIFVHIRVRMTEELDFIVEPAVPISIGACRFGGLPCRGVHDLQFVPAPTLRGDHGDNEQALEWKRHRLDRYSPADQFSGVLVVRQLDLDDKVAPFDKLSEWMNARRSDEAQVEFVVEDLAIPFAALTVATGLPIPSHGTVGLRRQIEAGHSQEEAFGHAGAPVRIEFGDWTLAIEQLLLRTPADAADQFIFLQIALLFGSDPDAAHAATIGVTDEWTVQAGYRHPTGLQLFKIADATLRLWGAKVGWSIARFASKDPRYEWDEQLQLLVDLGLTTKPTGSGLFKIRSLSGKDLEIVMRDVGWDLGEFSLEGLAFPEGVQFILADVVRLIVEDLGWVTENNGARYFSFSGGISVFGGGDKANRSPSAGAGSAAINDEQGKGGGIRFLRLRWLTGGNPAAAPWLLDGISVNLQWGTFSISGFGMVSEFTIAGNQYKEMGFGLNVKFRAIAKDFEIGVQFFQGRVEGPTENLEYWMFGFQFSPIPVGSFELVNVRLLLTGNMVPNLPPPDGYAQNMRIFRWYRNTGDAAIDLPSNRKAVGWIRQDESRAVGAGLGLGLSTGKLVIFELFVFYHESPTENGLMIAIEVYILKGTKPAGFGVIEFDIANDRWGLLVGVSLTLEHITGFEVPILGKFVSLTGTLYGGSKPGTFAIGQLNDQSTWLSFRSEVDTFVEAKLLVGLCVQVVDAPGGPRGAGLVFSAKGGASFGIGRIQLYAGFGFIAGVWDNESTETGFVAWIEADVRIKVFWIFSFGASIKIEFTYLGGEPSYRRLGVEFRIDTPWFMPDVTFRFDLDWGKVALATVRTISSPVVSSGSIQTAQGTQDGLVVTPVSGPTIDERALFTMDELRAAGAPTLPAGALDALTPTSVDSVIAVNFKPSVDDKLSIGEQTPAGAGTQQVNDLAATYGLVELGIRRRERFGPASATWTSLLAPQDTVLMNPADFPPGFEVAAHFTSTVSVRWDRDHLKENRLDPRRLLINAETPFTFLTSNPEGDESHARNDAAWPCCGPRRRRAARWHQLDFRATPNGGRVPHQQAFSDSSSRLHWHLPKPPQAVPTVPASALNAARVPLVGGGDLIFASVDFDRRAAIFEFSVQWQPQPAGQFIVQAYDGVDLVEQQDWPFGGPTPPQPITVERARGLTGIRLLIVDLKQDEADDEQETFFGVVRMRYRTVEDVDQEWIGEQKCRASKQSRLSGGGKLAWLPNHDYEVTVKTRVQLAHAASASQTADVVQQVFFRTKGYPGLNAVKRTGDELEQYVESTYPGASHRRLYRSEAVNIAFNERFNSLLPVDRMLSASDPAERNQILEWVLAVERVGGATTRDRISKTAPDWIVANRTTPAPIALTMLGVTDSTTVVPQTRSAKTRDARTARFEAVIAALPDCDPTAPSLHNSQVLTHVPIDPNSTGAGPQRWQAASTFRVNVRRKDAPFVERMKFDDDDWTAFEAAGEEGAAGTWTSAGGTMRLTAPSTARQHALFGEASWNHVQIVTDVDPQGGAAGVGVAVSSASGVSESLMVLIDQPSITLRIVRRSSSGTAVVATQPLPSGAAAPYPLQVLAFDDKVRATVGETVVEAERGDLREGRLSLVADGGGRFGSLIVEGLDAYRFQFSSSRFVDFPAHIGSFDGDTQAIPPGAMGPGASTGSVPGLLSSTQTDIAQVMQPDADHELRQRLFDRWVSELGLPLRSKVDRLELSRLLDTSDAAQLFLLESPEPLPFSEDVTVRLQRQFLVPSGCLGPFSRLVSRAADAIRRVSRLDPQKIEPPAALRQFADGLHFDGDRVAGVFRRDVLDHLVATPRRILRAVDSGGSRRLECYDVSLRPGRGRHLILEGFRIDQGPSGARTAPTQAFATLRAGEIGLADELGRAVGPFVPTTRAVYVNVDLLVLSNGDETRALLIPITSAGGSSPQRAGRYRFNFTLDRARFRAASPDTTTNYRASALLPFSW